MTIILVLLERFGKALRSPARDTILSVISKDIGAGKAFGIHELLDQIGAITGPAIVTSLMFATNNNYNFTFSFLFIPFIMLIIALIVTYKKVGAKTIMPQPPKIEGQTQKLAKPFYIYTTAVLINSLGLITFGLILFRASQILPETLQWMVPLIYLLIQGIDAPVALIGGYAYDKYGVGILTIPFVLSIFPPLFAVAATELWMIIVAAAAFGLVLGMQESVYRAAVSEFAPLSSRGTAYGIFNTAYGFGFLISGALYGSLIDIKAPFIITIIFVLATQVTATGLLLSIRTGPKKQKTEPHPT
jgi:MFS family permease